MSLVFPIYLEGNLLLSFTSVFGFLPVLKILCPTATFVINNHPCQLLSYVSLPYFMNHFQLPMITVAL